MNIKMSAILVLFLGTAGTFFFGYNIGSQLCPDPKSTGMSSHSIFYTDRAWDLKKGTMYNMPILGSVYAMGLNASTKECREDYPSYEGRFPFD